MILDFSTGMALKISMNMVIEEILSEGDIGSITVPTPANNNLFKIDATVHNYSHSVRSKVRKFIFTQQ